MAEVFFFLGGFSTFVAYSSLKAQPTTPASRRTMLWNRIRILCLAEAWMILGYAVMTGTSPFNLAALHPNKTASKCLLAVGLDILPVHILILSVVALFFHKLRNLEVRRLLFISVSVWACGWSIGSVVRLDPSLRTPELLFFNPFAAQLLYALGYSAAFWILSQERRDIREQLKSFWVTGAVVLIPTVFFALRHSGLLDLSSILALTSRQDFGPLRILNFLAILALLARISSTVNLERILIPFTFMGRRCLSLFAATTVAMYALQQVTLHREKELHASPILTIMFATLTIGLLAHFIFNRPHSVRSS